MAVGEQGGHCPGRNMKLFAALRFRGAPRFGSPSRLAIEGEFESAAGSEVVNRAPWLGPGGERFKGAPGGQGDIHSALAVQGLNARTAASPPRASKARRSISSAVIGVSCGASRRLGSSGIGRIWPAVRSPAHSATTPQRNKRWNGCFIRINGTSRLQPQALDSYCASCVFIHFSLRHRHENLLNLFKGFRIESLCTGPASPVPAF